MVQLIDMESQEMIIRFLVPGSGMNNFLAFHVYGNIHKL